jgi:hypothetical protein
MVDCGWTGSIGIRTESGDKNDDWSTSTDPEGPGDRGSERWDAVCPVSVKGKAALKQLSVDVYKCKGPP